MKTLAHFIILCAAGISLSSCGRYAPPVAPEKVAPEAVGALTVKGTLDGVAFTWRAPDSDQRGKSLTSLDGYRVYRKQLLTAKDAIDLQDNFAIVGSVADTAFAALTKAKDEAKAAGRPTRRVHISDDLKQFSFLDNGVKAGSTYLYKVVPYNQGGVEGESFQLVQVLWRGEASDVKSVDHSTILSEEELEE